MKHISPLVVAFYFEGQFKQRTENIFSLVHILF